MGCIMGMATSIKMANQFETIDNNNWDHMFRAKIIVAARITPRDRDKVQQQHRLKGNNFSTIEWITVITEMEFSSKTRMAKFWVRWS